MVSFVMDRLVTDLKIRTVFDNTLGYNSALTLSKQQLLFAQHGIIHREATFRYSITMRQCQGCLRHIWQTFILLTTQSIQNFSDFLPVSTDITRRVKVGLKTIQTAIPRAQLPFCLNSIAEIIGFRYFVQVTAQAAYCWFAFVHCSATSPCDRSPNLGYRYQTGEQIPLWFFVCLVS